MDKQPSGEINKSDQAIRPDQTTKSDRTVTPDITNVTDEQLLETLKRLDRFATMTDSEFRIPFTQIRFGLDSIIGLIPVVGETIGLLMSLYLISEAYKLGAPTSLKIKMFRNAIIDWLVGLIPVIGDVADVAYKANMRNLKLLVTHINGEYERRHPTLEESEKERKSRWVLVITVLVVVVLLYFGMVYYPVM